MSGVPWPRLLAAAATEPLLQAVGQVVGCAGLTVLAEGPRAGLGELCWLAPGPAGPACPAEVVGFRGRQMLLMPLGDLSGLGPGWEVRATGRPLPVPVGPALLGRVLDGLGRPLDGQGPVNAPRSYPAEGAAPPPLQRPVIDTPLPVGVRAIDGLLTIGRGQRVGIFAGSGVGKSTLLGMMARGTRADVSVIALVGERGREVRDFLERDLGEAGRRRAVVVVATADHPPLIRLKAAAAATAIAEYFRDEGQDVLLLLDSVTRLAMAQREVGLAVGEPPATRGYPPSVFTYLPRLLERAGRTEKGSITAFYTVLVEGDDLNEPVADAVRGTLDGHIVLDRELAVTGQYPAIDVLASLSRLMPQVADAEHCRLAAQARRLLAAHREARDLLAVGAYQAGADPLVDAAIERLPELNRYLCQDPYSVSDFSRALADLGRLLGGEGQA